jgi:hypothetical protein
MIEWDIECARRKFENTVCKVNEISLTNVVVKSYWAYIRNIKDGGSVFGLIPTVEKAWRKLGKIRIEIHPLIEDPDDVLIDFEYVSLPSGYYEDLYNPDAVWKIERRHGEKKYNIGLNYESHHIVKYVNGEDVGSDSLTKVSPNLSKLIQGYRKLSDKHIIFSRGLELKDNFLKLWGADIGFVKDKKVLVNNAKVIPIIQPHMGDEWLIKTI